MTTLSSAQSALHQRTVRLARIHERVEWKLIAALQDVLRGDVHRALGKRSLFLYARDLLDLPPAKAYEFCAVAKKGLEVSEMQSALLARQLTVSKAARIVSTIAPENAASLVAYAVANTTARIDQEVARLNPSKKKRAVVTPVDGETHRLCTDLSNQGLRNLKRAQSVHAQRGQPKTDYGSIVEAALEAYLNRHDPVRRADRAQKRAAKYSAHAETSARAEKSPAPRPPQSRQPVTAAQKHAVYKRCEGRCSYIDAQGHRCEEDRWVDIHHIIVVSEGGTNDPTNLTLLCDFHHGIVHQTGFNIDGETHWTPHPK